MALKALPFPVGAPAEEIDFLIQLVNREWPVLQSTGRTEAFLCVHRIFGRPATPQALHELENEARDAVYQIASGHRRLTGPMHTTGEGQDERDAADFSARVRRAVGVLLRSRRRPRLCGLNQDHFFFPTGKELYCRRCRASRLAHAHDLERAQHRSRQFRHRHRAQPKRERERLRAMCEALVEQLELDPSAEVGRRLAVAENRLALIERARPAPPPAAHPARWEVTIELGANDGDVRVSDRMTVTSEATSARVVVTFQGTYAELLEEYRASRRTGRSFVA